MEPGKDSGGDLHTHAGDEECVLVLEGDLELFLGSDRYLLEAGDAATFESRAPHRWRNRSPEPARLLWVFTPASY